MRIRRLSLQGVAKTPDPYDDKVEESLQETTGIRSPKSEDGRDLPSVMGIVVFKHASRPFLPPPLSARFARPFCSRPAPSTDAERMLAVGSWLA